MTVGASADRTRPDPCDPCDLCDPCDPWVNHEPLAYAAPLHPPLGKGVGGDSCQQGALSVGHDDVIAGILGDCVALLCVFTLRVLVTHTPEHTRLA